MGSTIKTLQDTVSRIAGDQTDNGGDNNNSGGNNNGVNNSHNDNCNVNNRSNSGNFCGIARRRGEFSYMTTARVATTNLHDMNHVTNPKISDTMART